MGSKFELSLVEDYVSDWGLYEAIREIIQNVYDQQQEAPENKAYYHYDPEMCQVRLGNLGAVLPVSSLLLGGSTKKAGDTRGQFGEGYKLAALVLTRLGKAFTVLNGGLGQRWTCRFKKSRKYGVPVFEFNVSKEPLLPTDKLEFVIDDIAPSEWSMIKRNTLMLRDEPYRQFETTKGHILLDAEEAGRFYVGGLFLMVVAGFQYGYDIAPKNLNLGRDRNVAHGFQMAWAASEMWGEARTKNEYMSGLADNLLLEDSEDTKFLVQKLASPAYEVQGLVDKFFDKHGKDAYPVPVGSIVSVPSGYRGVATEMSLAAVLKRHHYFPEATAKNTLHEDIVAWSQKYSYILPDQAAFELGEIISAHKPSVKSELLEEDVPF